MKEIDLTIAVPLAWFDIGRRRRARRRGRTLDRWILAAVLAPAIVLGTGSARGEEHLYVSGKAGVSVIDTGTMQVVRTFRVGPTAGIAITRDGRRLYAGSAAAEGEFEILAVDTGTGEVEARLAAAGRIIHLRLSDEDHRLWVSHARLCNASGECTGVRGFTVVDVPTLAVEAMLPDLGWRIALDPSGGLAYTTSFLGIAAIETTSFRVVSELPSICCLSGVIEIHPDGHTVYALGNEFGGFLSIVDLRRADEFAGLAFIRGQLPPPFDFQRDIAFSPDGARAYLPGYIGSENLLFVMDTSDPWEPILEGMIELEARPVQIALARDGLRAYLLNSDSSVSVVDVDSGAVLTTIVLPGEGYRILLGPESAPASSSAASTGSGCHIASSAEVPWAFHLLSLFALGLRMVFRDDSSIRRL
jgi:DNA-binding beta-propeller fold protein YncE